MTKKHSPTPVTRVNQLWRVRLWAGVYMTAVMSLLAPLNPGHTPTLERATAEPVKQATQPIEPRFFAKVLAQEEYGWDATEYRCLSRLWGKESAWNPEADNPNSSAFGIAQMLGETSKDPQIQIRNGLRYIQHRYETPCNAWLFWQKVKWY